MAPKGQKDTWKQKRERFDPNKGLWIGPNRKPILLFGAQYPTLQYIHELTHWNPYEMVLWGKQYFLKPSFTIAWKVYSRCTICPKYNPGKPLHSSQGAFHYLQALLKFGRLILSKCLPLKVTSMYLL